ncbi:MAG: hypothetical protein PWQ96_1661 [Clostridia bacterium]|jgi:cell division protein FtsA|nr:hypothetical protein [Clostridia bacterium]
MHIVVISLSEEVSFLIFALDVGTRTVMGMVLEQRETELHIKAACIEEHQGRAMLDGQIQDIPEVVKVVRKVKNKLEKKVDTKLKKVSVAAAGRALKTVEAQAIKKCDPSNAISKEAIYALQIEGLQKAQQKLTGDPTISEYYCVGYSIKRYVLDNSSIENLEGQYGKTMGVELIATFLPRVVVDSLHSVLTQCDLSIETLTLEPIAASHLIIEPGMRKLNLALVDIGAGTSDIAISKEGAIVAFGMVPYAGDEITESISETLLVDFTTAEKIKRQLKSNNLIKFKDVLGNIHEEKTEKIINKIKKSINELTTRIADEIVKLNGKSPSAVLCIGGGSQTPTLSESLANYLGLTLDRVAVRDRSAVKGISGFPKLVSGPESITPLGIAFTQWQGEGISLEFVEVNDKMVRVFGDDKLKVVDVLYAAGIPSSSIYGKPGQGITIEVNGKVKLIPGEKAKVAEILINNKPAYLDSFVKQGDKIKFKPARQGKPANLSVADIIPGDLNKEIIFNGDKIKIQPKIYVNGKMALSTLKLEDNDSVNWQEINTVEDLLNFCKYDISTVNKILVNNQNASLDAKINDGDIISLIDKNTDKNNEIEQLKGINIKVNGKEVWLPGESFILTDIFSVYNFSTTPPPDKKKLFMQVNGNDATFVTPLKDGDQVTLNWI